MKAFLRIVLGFISLSVALNSCSLRYHSDYKKTEAFETQNQDFIAHNFQKVLFKTQIQAFDKEVSGLLFIKQMKEDNYRFVFLTQIGMKIFDVELNKGKFTIHQLISYLDKKSVRKLLESDLKLLIQTPNTNTKTKFFEHKKDSSLLLRNKTKEGIFYYRYQKPQIQSKENSSFIFRGTTIQYSYSKSNIPDLIVIKHSGIHLQWKLKPIDKTTK